MASLVVWLLIAALLLGGTSNAIGGAEMFAYPKKGQTREQQQADRQTCETWADQQTASSPGAESRHSQERMRGGPLRGAMRGRMIGEASGESNAAAMGGGMAGMMRRRIEQKREEEQPRQAYHGKTDAHSRAYKACMEGRGYTVE